MIPHQLLINSTHNVGPRRALKVLLSIVRNLPGFFAARRNTTTDTRLPHSPNLRGQSFQTATSPSTSTVFRGLALASKPLGHPREGKRPSGEIRGGTSLLNNNQGEGAEVRRESVLVHPGPSGHSVALCLTQGVAVVGHDTLPILHKLGKDRPDPNFAGIGLQCYALTYHTRYLSG